MKTVILISTMFVWATSLAQNLDKRIGVSFGTGGIRISEYYKTGPLVNMGVHYEQNFLENDVLEFGWALALDHNHYRHQMIYYGDDKGNISIRRQGIVTGVRIGPTISTRNRLSLRFTPHIGALFANEKIVLEDPPRNIEHGRFLYDSKLSFNHGVTIETRYNFGNNSIGLYYQYGRYNNPLVRRTTPTGEFENYSFYETEVLRLVEGYESIVAQKSRELTTLGLKFSRVL